MSTATTDQKIGDYKEIYNQMGGNKFTTMTGSKVKYYGYDSKGYVYLMYELTRNKAGAKYLKIQYNSMDLYNMEFSKIKKTQNPEYKAIGLKIYDEQKIILNQYDNVYGEDLQSIFTSVTGLYTRLF